MKHILDKDFEYKPSFDTDIRKTYARIRHEQLLKRIEEEKDAANPPRET